MVHILLSALLTLFTCNKAGRLEDTPHRRSKNKKPSSAVGSLPILQYCRWNGQRLWWELPPCSCMVEVGHGVFTLLIYAAQYHCSYCRQVGDTHTFHTVGGKEGNVPGLQRVLMGEVRRPGLRLWFTSKWGVIHLHEREYFVICEQTDA